MARKPKAQPPQKGQSKNKAFQPILRQNQVPDLAKLYYNGFGDFQEQQPATFPGILQPKYDCMFYEMYLTLTHKTRRPIWKRI